MTETTGGRPARRPPLSIRLDDELETWLRDHAEQTGQSVNQVVAQLVTDLRTRTELKGSTP